MPTSTCFRVNMDIVLDWTLPEISQLSAVFFLVRCMHNTTAALTKSSFRWQWAQRFKVNNVDVQEILEKKKVVANRDRFETCYFYWAHLTFSSVVPAGLDSLYQQNFSCRITAYRKGCWYIATGWNLNKSCCSERNFSQPYPIDHSFSCSFYSPLLMRNHFRSPSPERCLSCDLFTLYYFIRKNWCVEGNSILNVFKNIVLIRLRKKLSKTLLVPFFVWNFSSRFEALGRE